MFRPIFFLILSTLFFASCGGSSGGSDTEPAPDTVAPVILLNGSGTVTIIQGSTYVEAGATATDDQDGSVDISISGSVDTSTVGIYTITYTATDAANNIRTATRTVDVVPGPFITTWKTDNPGTTESNQIKIGTAGSGYDYSINWGDGLTDTM